MSDISDGAAIPFGLLQNPFFILKVDPSAPLDRIAEAVEDALADGEVAEDDVMAAREALINPRQRTITELSYLFDSPSTQVARLVKLLKEPPSSEILKEVERSAPLSRSNFLAEAASRSPASSDILFSILDAHAQVSPPDLLTKIQSVRRQAGIVSPSLEAIEESLNALYERHVKAALSGLRSATAASKPLRACTRRILALPDEDRLQALDRMIRAYAQFASSELGEIEERITSLAEQLKTRQAATNDIENLSNYLRRWKDLAQPLIESEAKKGRDDVRSRQLYYTIRNLCIERSNQYDDFGSALAISESAAEIFKSLPRASEQLVEDTQLLKERIVEAKVTPLKRYIDSVSKWTIAADLENAGFGPSAKGMARDLWNLFLTTLNDTKHSMAADLPWILTRGLAIDLNNQENSPVAAKAIVEQLLRMASDTSPSPEVLEKLHDDLRAVTKNATEKRVLKLVEGGDTSAALHGLEEILRGDLNPEDRALYNQLRGRLQSQRNGRFVKWTFFGLIAIVFIGANMSNNTSPSLQPPRTQQPSPEPPSSSPPTPRPTPPKLPIPAPEQPDLSEVKPPIGSGNAFTRANIRYCKYQKARLKSIEGELYNSFEVGEFNKLVDDYNVRCSNYRYYDNDLRVVDEEVRAKGAMLIEEGRRITANWRSRLNTPDSSRVDEKSITPNFPTPENTPVPSHKTDISPPDDAATNLLNLDTAKAAQKRLLELSFFRGPVDGVWGPQSRNALRAFKIENGLPADDIYDGPTAGRLASTTATRATTGGRSSTTATEPMQESHYAPRGGTTINPLNRSDAARINSKLRELGYYRLSNNELWSAASREALKEFKIRNGLEASDVWDIDTEQRLMLATAPDMSVDMEAAFSAIVTGAWTTDLRACQGAVGGSDALVVTMTTKSAETEGARCDFQSFSGAGVNWKVAAVCNVSGEVRKTTINLVRSNDMLIWSSPRGTTKYLRCPG